MANDAGSPPGPLGSVPTPETELSALDFFQALRRIECAHRERPRLGQAAHASDEPVRLGQEPSMAFEPAALASYTEGEHGRPPRLAVGFFGAFGPHGPLPLHLTEYAHQRARNAHDPTFARFVDLFHHRLLLLFYRAWASAQPVVSHDRKGSDVFAGYVGALIGQLAPAKDALTRELDAFSLSMAGHFTGNARHPEGLEKLLSEYFGVRAQIEEFVGEWLSIPDSFTWKLAQGDGVEGTGRLGLGSRLGRRVFERQFKFRVVLGPLRRAVYDQFLADGALIRPLISLVERYIGQELDWDVRLILEEPDRQPTQLGSRGRLGRDAHLIRSGSSEGMRPFQDLIFTPVRKAG